MLRLINIVSIIMIIGLVIISRKCLEIVRVGTKNRNLYYKEINRFMLIASILLINSVILSGITLFRVLTA